MKRLWWMLAMILLISCITGCVTSPQQRQTSLYCPPPPPPAILKEVKTLEMKSILMDLKAIVEYAKGLELQVQCYEASLNAGKEKDDAKNP